MGVSKFLQRLQNRSDCFFEEYQNWKGLAQVGREELPNSRFGAQPYNENAALAGGRPYLPLKQGKEERYLLNLAQGDTRRRDEKTEILDLGLDMTTGNSNTKGESYYSYPGSLSNGGDMGMGGSGMQQMLMQESTIRAEQTMTMSMTSSVTDKTRVENSMTAQEQLMSHFPVEAHGTFAYATQEASMRDGNAMSRTTGRTRY